MYPFPKLAFIVAFMLETCWEIRKSSIIKPCFIYLLNSSASVFDSNPKKSLIVPTILLPYTLLLSLKRD